MISRTAGGLARRERAVERMAQELQSLHKELALLGELSAALVSMQQEGEIASRALELVLELVPASAYALLAGEEGFPMRLLAAEGISDEKLARLASSVSQLVQPAAELGPRAWAAVVPSGNLGLQSSAAAVLAAARAEEGPLAVLVMLRQRGEKAFGPLEKKLASAAVCQIALALTNLSVRERLRNLLFATVGALAQAMEANDPCAPGHCWQVSMLATAVGRRLGLAQRALEDLQLAGLMHDLGKLAVEAAVLLKPGALDAAEWALIKAHPIRSAQILAGIPELEAVVQAVKYHHERLDGSGYPEGLAGEEIPLLARIVAVCDAYSAMVSARPYRPALPSDQALAELQAEPRKYDPRVVAALAAAVKEQAQVKAQARQPA
jgi:HD-GYP domain-containing protein (c-di-GMP phosphodiesterase class II)